MSSKRKPRPRWDDLCADLGPEDGTDPRDFFNREEQRESGRKARQLSRQVERALYWALGSACDDPVLQSLVVVSVEPAPNSARMLVTLKSDEADPEDVLARIANASGMLRTEVARSIHRRKVPELIYRVI